MLLMQKKKFCFLAAPKTGTTAIESWVKVSMLNYQ